MSVYSYFDASASVPRRHANLEELKELMTNEIALKNLTVIGTLQPGEKLSIAEDRVTFEKEDREMFLTLRRWWCSSFDPVLVEASYETFIEYRKNFTLRFAITNNSETYLPVIVRCFGTELLSYKGLKCLKVTYYEENKLPMAEELLRILVKYQKETLEALRSLPRSAILSAKLEEQQTSSDR